VSIVANRPPSDIGAVEVQQTPNCGAPWAMYV
jgi:hypothetical protein